MKKVAEWLGGNWGWLILIMSVFFEITPIKLHPVSALLGWVGKKMNGSLQKDFDDFKAETRKSFQKVEERQDKAEKDADLLRMSGIKTTVLDFANSCMNGRLHTKEEFDHVIAENKVYEKLVKKYGSEIQNDVYKEGYAYILRIYRKCLDEKKFLKGE